MWGIELIKKPGCLRVYAIDYDKELKRNLRWMKGEAF